LNPCPVNRSRSAANRRRCWNHWGAWCTFVSPRETEVTLALLLRRETVQETMQRASHRSNHPRMEANARHVTPL